MSLEGEADVNTETPTLPIKIFREGNVFVGFGRTVLLVPDPSPSERPVRGEWEEWKECRTRDPLVVDEGGSTLYLPISVHLTPRSL